MKASIAIVACNTHGQVNSRNGEREVKVPMPATKKISRSGCPQCKRERELESKRNK